MAKELLFSVTKNDFEMQTFRSGGKGGQKQNKTSSAVRLIHKESGAVGESRTYREQSRNKVEAFRRLMETKEWKLWYNRKVFEYLGKESIDDKVKKQLYEENLKFEVKDENGNWVEVNDEYWRNLCSSI